MAQSSPMQRPRRKRLAAPGRAAASDTPQRLAELAWAGQHEQAIAVATDALAAAGLDVALRVELLEQRAASRSALADHASAQVDAQAMLHLARDAHSPALEALALCRMAAVQTRLDRYLAAAESAQAALAAARQARHRWLQAMALFRLSEAQFRAFDNEAALRHAAEAVDIFRALGDRVWQGRALWAQAYAHDQMGRSRERERDAGAALALARDAGDQEGIGAAANLLYREHADMALRLKGLKQSLAAFLAAGQQERAGASLGNLGMAYGAIGLYARARNPAGPGLAVQTADQQRQGTPYFTVMQSVIEGQLGHIDNAQRLANQAAEAGADIDDPWLTTIVQLVLGRAARLHGRTADARKHFEAAVALAEARRDTTLRIVTLTELGSLLVDSGDAAAALATTRQAVEHLHARGDAGLGSMFTPASAWWWHSRALRADGLDAQADRALATSYRVMLGGAASLSDEGLRRSWFNKVESHRHLIRAWLAEGRRRGLPSARYLAHLSAKTQLREPFERLVDTGVRLNQLHSAEALHEFLVEEATELSGAERVLLVLPGRDGGDGSLRIAASMLPLGEDALALLQAITPWLDDARHTRLTSLRHGPDGADAVDQRSCLVAPLIAQHELLGWLYCDIEGAFGRFHAADRDLLAMLAAQAAVALANIRASQGLEAKVAERTAEAQAARERAEARAGELAVINGIQQGMAEEISFQGIVELVGDRLREVFNTGSVLIIWWDAIAGLAHYLYAYQRGVRVNIAPTRPNLDGPMIKAFMANRPVVANNRAEMTALGLRTVPGTDPSLSTAQMPFFAGDRFLGTIALDNHEREGAYGEAEVRLLSTVAASMGMALQNARNFDETQRLLQETERRSSELALINDIQHALAEQPDFRAIVDVIGDKLHALFGSDSIGITWRDEKTDLIHNLYIVERGQRLQLPPFAYDPNGAMARALGSGKPVVLKDRAATLAFGIRTAPGTEPSRSSVFMPVMVGQVMRAAIRLVSLDRDDAFDEATVNLLSTVAASMGVALEKARLYQETQEALERETASAEVLRVVGGSMADAQPVFESICASMSRLLPGAELAIGSLGDDGLIHWRAGFGESLESMRQLFPRPAPASAKLLTGKASFFPDLLHGEGVPDSLREGARKLGRNCAMLSAAMTMGDQVYGTISAFHFDMRPFSDDDARLIKSFADQAVIAIQNSRMFKETNEALERQTATSEILKVISESPTDVQPVFEAIVQTGMRLFPGAAVAVSQPEGSQVVLRAIAGDTERAAAWRAVYPFPLTRDYMHGEALLDCRRVDVPDVAVAGDRYVRGSANFLNSGYRALTVVPMTRAGTAIGAISVVRPDPGPLSAQQLELLDTFADQAVIAIENVRLFNDTKESLQQQKASAEVLAVISNSVSDAQPVFEKILDSCKHLFGGDELDVLLVDEQGQLDIAAYRGVARDIVAATFPAPVERTPAGRALRERRVMHWPDLIDGDDVPGVLRKMAKLIGYRSMVFAPMLWNERGIGAIGVARSTGPFKPKELAMLQTFADQAVIAIQNARLFNETKEALETQTATADVLRVISHRPRRAAGVRRHRRARQAAVRRDGQRRVALRRAAGAPGGLRRRVGTGRRPGASSFPDAAEQRVDLRACGPGAWAGADRRHRSRGGLRATAGRGRARGRLPQQPVGADVQGRQRDRLDHRLPGRAGPLPGQPGQAAADLRRPGGDRDRERAAVQRDQGGA